VSGTADEHEGHRGMHLVYAQRRFPKKLRQASARAGMRAGLRPLATGLSRRLSRDSAIAEGASADLRRYCSLKNLAMPPNSRTEIIQPLKDSFTSGHHAAAALTSENPLHIVCGPGGNKAARVFALLAAVHALMNVSRWKNICA
jgi:hypothetical protein